jgi:hypothetical protein
VLNQLAVLFACLCVLGGAALLYLGFSFSDADQTIELVGGAVLFCLGLALFRPALKTWRELKRYRRG